MSAQGSAPRATLDLKVRVWGMGSNNQPFFQHAMAQNISATGACLFGIEPELKVGDVIGVQYETRKARCRVIWVVDAGALKKDSGRRATRCRPGLSLVVRSSRGHAIR
jgi:hypothetical protein